MVKLNKIYTRTGDDGTTGLVNGPRRLKNDLRIEAYGTVDEANSCLGLARLHTQAHPQLDTMMAHIQNDLFDLGADLATPDDNRQKGTLRIIPVQVERLENDIDLLNENLSPLTSFVLPGGTPASAYLHLARTTTRRAERILISLRQHENVSPEAVQYLNRLSDFLFVAARYANHKGQADVLWVPGQNR